MVLYIKWDNITHVVQIDKRILFNPNDDGINQVDLNIRIDYYRVHNRKFVYPLETLDMINISLIPEMKVINNIIHLSMIYTWTPLNMSMSQSELILYTSSEFIGILLGAGHRKVLILSMITWTINN